MIPIECEAVDTAAEEGSADKAIVLEEGSVGPFYFVILQAAENDPSSVLRWLEENDYDQPEGTGPLLNYYATNDHAFVALRLRKDTESGDIQPLIVTYTMPEPEEEGEVNTTEVARRAMACVPIQLTRVAATESMPIQVYIFGEGRAVPLNFLDLELDDIHVDWLGCLNNPACYDDDYRRRFDQAASQLVNHSFVTEYAGPSNVMDDQIVLPVTAEEIASSTSFTDFSSTYRFLLPNIPLVDTILDDYMSSDNFDAAALAKELDEKVLQPAKEAQEFVDKFSYLTRLYARLSPENMTKDPFFTFKPELPPVDNVHLATAVPVCNEDDQPTALLITVDRTNDYRMFPATLGCFGWQATGPAESLETENGTVSLARRLVSWGYTADAGVIVSRSDDGSFDEEAVQEAILFGDSLVMNQTIPHYSASSSSTSLSWRSWRNIFPIAMISSIIMCLM